MAWRMSEMMSSMCSKPTEILISPSVMPTSSLCCRDNFAVRRRCGMCNDGRVSPKLGEMDNIITPLIVFYPLLYHPSIQTYDATPLPSFDFGQLHSQDASSKGIPYIQNLLSLFQKSCQFECVFTMTIHPDRQCFQTFRQNPGIKGDSVGPAFRIKGMICDMCSLLPAITPPALYLDHQ